MVSAVDFDARVASSNPSRDDRKCFRNKIMNAVQFQGRWPPGCSLQQAALLSIALRSYELHTYFMLIRLNCILTVYFLA